MLVLEYNHSTLVSDPEPNRFHKCIDGRVQLRDDDDAATAIGRFSVIVIDVESAVNEREDMFDVFDCSSRTVDYFSLYTDDMEFVPKVTKVLKGGERWAPNMLVLDRLEIFPKYRRNRYGLHVLRWLQFHFGIGCGIVVMKPFPLQFESGMKTERGQKDFAKLRLGEFTDNKAAALRKLRTYYGQAGFVRVQGTEYMVADPFFVAQSLGRVDKSSPRTGTDDL
ncbi:hypothetical protein ABL840_05125 [Variovorax sp. NFACC27]|uniref:hypothetical protein n=1 Tax=unclassified Variovorax TaxID=663243 RepID=UPI000895780C|nr:hypothetical protein SAMN03159371_00157 [Variovorax sp. NFACC28]SEF71063.1 hypothetical protein SAMN03159365_00661 [Variovorax sp. NFACC29]SFB76673.1 hypothetical protein SAMN03159379_00660 [Variovorax sp. NFACC26]SFG76341.1 hypothetical protein SAMN03159447_04783 [Variovorax sp. NFACC27]